MRTVRHIVLIGALGLGSLSLAVPARAQDKQPAPLEGGFGYNFLATTGTSGQTFPLGFSIGAGRDVMREAMRCIGLFGDFRWNYRSESQMLYGTDITSSTRITSLFGGPKVAWKLMNTPFRPFFRFEAGLGHLSYSQDYGKTSYGSSENAFGYMAAGGIDFKINRRMSFYAQFGFGRYQFSNPDNWWVLEGGLDEVRFLNWLKGPSAELQGAPADEGYVSDTPEAHRRRAAYDRVQEAHRKWKQAMAKTDRLFDNGKATAPQKNVDAYDDALSAAHKAWADEVKAGGTYERDKSDANKKALDEATKKTAEAYEKVAEEKEKLIESMTKEARTKYFDAEDAERAASQEMRDAEKALEEASKG